MVSGSGETLSFNPNDPIVRHMLKVRAQHAEQQQKDYSHVFRPKSILDLIRLSCIILGVELTYAAETSFVSPVLLQMGVEHQHMTMVWSLAPVLGFFLAPLLGSISDRCRWMLGRRRPMIIALCVGIFIGLLFIPYGKDIGIFLGDSEDMLIIANSSNVNETTTIPSPEVTGTASSHMFAIVLVVIGTILIDFDVNTAQTPCRAYILDVSIPADHAKVLSSFTVMAGLGGTLGYALGGINWETTSIGSFFGGNMQTVFAIVTVWFLIFSFITLTSFREVPLPLMEKDELLRPLTAAAIKKELQKKSNGIAAIETMVLDQEPNKDALESQVALASEDFTIAGSIPNLTEKPVENGIIEEDEDEEKVISLREYMTSVVKMPKAMWILCLTNVLCWMADFCYCLYFTDFVGETVFHGSPTAPPNSEQAILYEEGVRFGCWGLAIYALSCSVYSSFIEKLIKWLNTRVVYTGGILVFSIGMAVLALWPTKISVLVFSAAAGSIYATMFTMPYILVAQYHSHGCFKVKDGQNVEMKKPRGLGTDIAIISSMAFVAQLIISLGIGSVISLLQSTAAVLYTATTLGIAAALCSLKCLYLA